MRSPGRRNSDRAGDQASDGNFYGWLRAAASQIRAPSSGLPRPASSARCTPSTAAPTAAGPPGESSARMAASGTASWRRPANRGGVFKLTRQAPSPCCTPLAAPTGAAAPRGLVRPSPATSTARPDSGAAGRGHRVQITSSAPSSCTPLTAVPGLRPGAGLIRPPTGTSTARPRRRFLNRGTVTKLRSRLHRRARLRVRPGRLPAQCHLIQATTATSTV